MKNKKEVLKLEEIEEKALKAYIGGGNGRRLIIQIIGTIRDRLEAFEQEVREDERGRVKKRAEEAWQKAGHFKHNARVVRLSTLFNQPDK